MKTLFGCSSSSGAPQQHRVVADTAANKLLDINAKNNMLIPAQELEELALKSIRFYDLLPEDNKKTAAENNYPKSATRHKRVCHECATKCQSDYCEPMCRGRSFGRQIRSQKHQSTSVVRSRLPQRLCGRRQNLASGCLRICANLTNR